MGNPAFLCGEAGFPNSADSNLTRDYFAAGTIFSLPFM